MRIRTIEHVFSPFFIGTVMLFCCCRSYADSSLILTGKLASANKQVITAPKNSRRQVQIQWLEEDGTVVEKGDLVATFDGSNLQTEIDGLIEQEDILDIELEQISLTLEQEYLEAQGDLAVSEMRVEQAKIEASVPDGQVSDFEKGQYELEHQRQIFELFKAQEAKTLAKQALDSGVNKKQLQIIQIKERIAFKRKQLKNMSVYADYTGPINYATHPWTGKKIDAGINVNTTWHVMDVQSIGSFLVESWVHEIDAPQLQEGLKVSVVFDAYPHRYFSATLTKKSTQGEKIKHLSNSTYFPLVFEFDSKPDIELLSGMSIRIEI